MLQLMNYSLVALCCIILNAVISCYCISYFKSPSTGKIQKPLFLPVDYKWQSKKCKELGFKMMNICIPKKTEKYRNVPKSIMTIPGDGNCFFSALSYWITGAINYGGLLRKIIVDYMKNSKSFKLMTKEEERETRISKMYNICEYAESPEIATAAEFLKISIYIYSLYPLEGWHFISKNGVVNKDENERCIYLINYKEHYNVVLDVYPDREARQPEDIEKKMNEYSDYNISIDLSKQSISKPITNFSYPDREARQPEDIATKEIKQNKTPQPVPKKTKDNQKLLKYTNEHFENYITEVKNRIRTEEIEQQRLDKLNNIENKKISNIFRDPINKRQDSDMKFNKFVEKCHQKWFVAEDQDSKPMKKEISLINEHEQPIRQFNDVPIEQEQPTRQFNEVPIEKEHVHMEYFIDRLGQKFCQPIATDISLVQNYRTPVYPLEIRDHTTETSYPSEISDQTTKKVRTPHEDTSFILDFFYRIHQWENYHL
ncbi:uncharacterized protein LOC126895265 [Daktulosphaira vitifoliae]|uniref:uncharacterized protein LOC126895265 n=1 Tax=Daktulosphaira vitifoliae TaxID=58002 RepID=UPI0021AA2AFD|nr:uncharacterized protein LOC126895265 [Daktulosphaira vitifoliae]